MDEMQSLLGRLWGSCLGGASSLLSAGLLLKKKVQPADSSRPSVCTPLSFSAYCLCASCTLGRLWAWAAFHCITWFQTQLILTTCQIRYHATVGSSTALNLDSERSSRVL